MGRSSDAGADRPAAGPPSPTEPREGRPPARRLLAERMSAQFDAALSEAAETIEWLESAWVEPVPPADEPLDDCLPLEFQLADLERAVDIMMQERDRMMFGTGSDEARESGDGSAPPSPRAPGGARR